MAKTLFVLLALVAIGQALKLEQIYKWKEVEFAWPSAEARRQAIDSGSYIVENNLPLGLDIWKDKKLFITVPRWKAGVASSLNYIKLDENQTQSPILNPYPRWETNTIESSGPRTNVVERVGGHDSAAQATVSDVALKNNASIISTFRIRVDECDRLWVMDSGLAGILEEQPKQIAPPALVIFDLNTDTLIRRYAFKPTDSKAGTFFANVIVDVNKNDCDNAYAYVPDLGAYGVVVYSFKEDDSWRTEHNFFHFDPLNGDYNVGGVNFQWTDGVFGMALGRPAQDGSRTVYFHALSSTTEFSVPNYVLQNRTRSESRGSFGDFAVVGTRGINGQATAEYLDPKTNVLFYTQVNKDAVQCWNVNKPYTPDTQGLVDSDTDALVFPNDLKVDENDNLWVLSDRMPIFLFKKLDPNQFNYRILKAKVADIIRETPICAA